jgi:RNA polymerase sigma factor (sigma-70 family)
LEATVLPNAETPRPDNRAEWDDGALILASQRDGDVQATNELILRYRQRVRRAIARQGLHRRLAPPDVEDAEQQGILGVYEAIFAYRAGPADDFARGGFATFVDRVVDHNLLDHWRRERTVERRSVRRLPLLDPQDAEAPGSLERRDREEALIDEHTGPAELAAVREILMLLAKALGTLADVDRLICERQMQGRSQEDIAKELGWSRGQVKYRWKMIGLRVRARMHRFVS